MKRREFITPLGGAVVTRPVAAQAQPADRRPLVGYLVETTKEAHASRIAAFLEGMRDLSATRQRHGPAELHGVGLVIDAHIVHKPR